MKNLGSLKRFMRSDIDQVVAQIIDLGYLVVSESGDPEITPDYEDTIRIWCEMDHSCERRDPGYLYLTGAEQWWIEREMRSVWGN